MAETKTEKKTTTPKIDRSKFAVIRTGGKQYVVYENETLNVELLDVEEGKNVDLEVLLIADGDKVEVGTPLVDGAKLAAVAGGEVKGDKKVIFKYKKRKNYRVKTGHRQHYTEIKIEKIALK